MRIEVLKKMDRIAKAAASRDPDDLLAYMGYVFIDPGNSVDGFIMRRKGTTYYGVSRNLTGKKYDFGVMHEGFHGLCGHLDFPGFLNGAGAHTDIGSFSDFHLVASTERDANIGAADFVVDTEAVLDMMGYDNADVVAYRASVESFEQAVRDYKRHYSIVRLNGSPEGRVRRLEAYQQELARMYEELQEQARDIRHGGCCLTKGEMAQEACVPAYIIDFKLEALEVRGYDVSGIELPTFDKVFSRWQ